MNEVLERVAEVRAFNRLYTEVIGALDEGLVGTPYSLTEARVLYELGRQEVTEVTELRNRLGLDPGYASRLLTRLESRGLLTRDKSPSDARRQVARLTEPGRDARRSLDQRTIDQIGDLLGRLSEEDQRHLLESMRAISRMFTDPAPSPVVLRPPRAGDYGWIVQRHGVRYAQEYGWDATFEAKVARIVADYIASDEPHKAAWIAELDGARAGSIACSRGRDDKTAQLRLLLLEPRARGRGVGKRLVTECVEFARSAGYAAMELDTYNVLEAARGIYRKAGFELVGSEPVHHYGHALTSETWRREL